MSEECQRHGATQDGLPCAYCHTSGRYCQVPRLPDESFFVDHVKTAFVVTYDTYSLERFRHRDGREWRVWMLVEST